MMLVIYFLQTGNAFVKIGYARVSTEEQSLNLQFDALKAAGCEKVFQDNGISGVVADRPALKAALAAVGPGDVLVVWKLDRLGRSLGHLIQLINELGQREAGFQSLSESIDTTTAGGLLLFHVMGALAQFERALISERTKAGMKAAKQRGQVLGRPRKLTDDQIREAGLLIAGGTPRKTVARFFGVAPETLRRSLAEQSTKPNERRKTDDK